MRDGQTVHTWVLFPAGKGDINGGLDELHRQGEVRGHLREERQGKRDRWTERGGGSPTQPRNGVAPPGIEKLSLVQAKGTVRAEYMKRRVKPAGGGGGSQERRENDGISAYEA